MDPSQAPQLIVPNRTYILCALLPLAATPTTPSCIGVSLALRTSVPAPWPPQPIFQGELRFTEALLFRYGYRKAPRLSKTRQNSNMDIENDRESNVHKSHALAVVRRIASFIASHSAPRVILDFLQSAWRAARVLGWPHAPLRPGTEEYISLPLT